MRVIDLADPKVDLKDLLTWAGRETLILRQSKNKSFVLAPIDNFTLETEILRNNQEFMTYLDKISEEKATYSLDEIEKELDL